MQARTSGCNSSSSSRQANSSRRFATLPQFSRVQAALVAAAARCRHFWKREASGSRHLIGTTPQATSPKTAADSRRPMQDSRDAVNTKLVLVVGVALLRSGSTPCGDSNGGSTESGAGGGAAEATVFLAQRPPGKANEGLWEFPGGKVEAGETPERALVRELQEELGISIQEQDLWPLTFASHPYPTFHLLMPLYGCRRWIGEPCGAEGQAVAWASQAQLLAGSGGGGAVARYLLTPADIPLVPDVVRALQQCR